MIPAFVSSSVWKDHLLSSEVNWAAGGLQPSNCVLTAFQYLTLDYFPSMDSFLDPRSFRSVCCRHIKMLSTDKHRDTDNKAVLATVDSPTCDRYTCCLTFYSRNQSAGLYRMFPWLVSSSNRTEALKVSSKGGWIKDNIIPVEFLSLITKKQKAYEFSIWYSNPELKPTLRACRKVHTNM